MCLYAWHWCGGQRTPWRTQLSPSTGWILGTRLRFGGKHLYRLSHLTGFSRFLFKPVRVVHLIHYQELWLNLSINCETLYLAFLWAICQFPWWLIHSWASAEKGLGLNAPRVVHLWTRFLDIENWAFFSGDEEDRGETCRLNIERNHGVSKTFGRVTLSAA